MKVKLLNYQLGQKFIWRNKSKYIRFLFLFSLLFLFFLLVKSANLKWGSYGLKEGGRLRVVSLFNRLLVFDKTRLIWTSPSEWQVKDFFIADLTQDKQEDLNLVVYKKGRYGDLKPFWVEEDEEIGFHLFILGIDEGKVIPVWQSSQVEKPICQAEARDVDGDGDNELVVKEGDNKKRGYSCRRASEAVWQWNGWGFTKKEI